MVNVERHEVTKEKQPFKHQVWWWESEEVGEAATGATADFPAAPGEGHHESGCLCSPWRSLLQQAGVPEQRL